MALRYVVDRHRVDADPDPTFHFEAETDPDPDPALSFTHVRKSLIFVILFTVP
jgi:hypothetical protein